MRRNNNVDERVPNWMLINIADREREMTGRERIKAREEMILQKRHELRGRPRR
ncbi:hypothetical protein FRC11_003826, partial [Ceratobasidium sp. 423]